MSANIVTNFLDWLFNVAPIPGVEAPAETVPADQRTAPYLPRVRPDGTYDPEGEAHFPRQNLPVGPRGDLGVAPDYSRVGVPQGGGRSLLDILATFFNANGLTLPGTGGPTPLPPILPPNTPLYGNVQKDPIIPKSPPVPTNPPIDTGTPGVVVEPTDYYTPPSPPPFPTGRPDITPP